MTKKIEISDAISEKGTKVKKILSLINAIPNGFKHFVNPRAVT